MNSLNNQLNVLKKTIDSSPYLSAESCQALEEQGAELSTSISKGEMSGSLGHKRITELDLKAASDEVLFLIDKVSRFNPSSPRLGHLRDVSIQLQTKEISAEQTRIEIHKIMCGSVGTKFDETQLIIEDL